MAKTQQKTFSVYAVACVWTNVEIKAESWEAAVEQAQSLKVTDFVDILGDHNDSNLYLTGIHDGSGLKKLD